MHPRGINAVIAADRLRCPTRHRDHGLRRRIGQLLPPQYCLLEGRSNARSGAIVVKHLSGGGIDVEADLPVPVARGMAAAMGNDSASGKAGPLMQELNAPDSTNCVKTSCCTESHLGVRCAAIAAGSTASAASAVAQAEAPTLNSTPREIAPPAIGRRGCCSRWLDRWHHRSRAVDGSWHELLIPTVGTGLDCIGLSPFSCSSS